MTECRVEDSGMVTWLEGATGLLTIHQDEDHLLPDSGRPQLNETMDKDGRG